MNHRWSGWVDFMARCFIIAFMVYLALSAFFISDFKKLSRLLDSVEKEMQTFTQQNKIYSTLFTTGNPEILYVIALQDEQNGDLGGAAKKLLTAIQVSDLNSQKYRAKLQALLGKSGQNP